MHHVWIIVYSVTGPMGGVSNTLPPYTQYPDKAQCENAAKNWPKVAYPVCDDFNQFQFMQQRVCGPLKNLEDAGNPDE